MILTEEQRDAIKYAISSLEQCGSEPEDLVVVKILRAMIDSSEHIREPPKMVGFDLEKARAEVDTASSRRFSESREQARIFCAEEILPDALDEIERLRAALDESEQILAHKTKTATHWYDEHLQARADRVQTRRVVEQQAARIQELEDAHKRSGVKYAKIINELRSSVYANIPGLKKQWDEILNAPANGKIGPDARPKCDHEWQAAIEERGYQTCLKCGECRNIEDIPRTAPAWQITEERKAALSVIGNMKTLIVCPHCKTPIEFADIPPYMAVLRAMLEEEEEG